MKQGVRGYYYDKSNGTYHVRVHHNGKNHHVGRFLTPAEARSARLSFITSIDAPKTALLELARQRRDGTSEPK